MKSVLAVAPTVEPVTLAELKQHVAMTHSDDDAILSLYLSAARDAVERHTGLFLSPQEWDVYLQPGESIPINPVRDVVSVDGITGPLTQTTSAFAYDPALESLSFDPVDGALRYVVRVATGFAGPALIPPAARVAILMLAADLYNNRETNTVGVSVTANPAVEFILYPLRHNVGV